MVFFNDDWGKQYEISPGVHVKSGFEFDLTQCGFYIFMTDQSVDRMSLNHPNCVFENAFFNPYCRDCRSHEKINIPEVIELTFYPQDR